MAQSLPAAVTAWKTEIICVARFELQLERFSTWRQTPLTNVSHPEVVLRAFILIVN